MNATNPSRSGDVHGVIDGPLVAAASGGWQVGEAPAPSAPDAATARTARLEARLAVYAQYAAVLAEEAAAAVGGDGERRTVLAVARGETAEHFAELRELHASAPGPLAFDEALNDALHELRHQDTVDDALAGHLRALREAAAVREFAPALTPSLAAGDTPPPRLDLRF